MSEQRRNLGRWGEDAARDYLSQCGLKVVAANVRTPVGEIDLVVRDGRIKVFVEVKTRRGQMYGTPAESVTWNKQRHVIRAAQWYLAETGEEDAEIRFDVVAVSVENGRVAIEHIPAAFETNAD